VWNIREYDSRLDVGNIFPGRRPHVPYITVSQNDEGLTGQNELDMDGIPNVLVLSAGGYGHVPIPLFKQKERRNNFKPVPDRTYDVSYVGSLRHAPHRLRDVMHEHLSNATTTSGGGTIHYKYFYSRFFGWRWRQVMADSRFSLCPRGYGRTSYHLVETLQASLIPIHVYSDVPWIPFPDVYNKVGLVAHYQGMEDLVVELKRMSAQEIAERERRILQLVDSHFSVDGVLNQIQRFLLNEENDLRCQKLPDTVRG